MLVYVGRLSLLMLSVGIFLKKILKYWLKPPRGNHCGYNIVLKQFYCILIVRACKTCGISWLHSMLGTALYLHSYTCRPRWSVSSLFALVKEEKKWRWSRNVFNLSASGIIEWRGKKNQETFSFHGCFCSPGLGRPFLSLKKKKSFLRRTTLHNNVYLPSFSPRALGYLLGGKSKVLHIIRLPKYSTLIGP